MGDAGEGLIDADSRIQERIDEREEAKKRRSSTAVRDPERERSIASLRLARTELRGQLDATTHTTRREQIVQAIAEVERRIGQLS